MTIVIVVDDVCEPRRRIILHRALRESSAPAPLSSSLEGSFRLHLGLEESARNPWKSLVDFQDNSVNATFIAGHVHRETNPFSVAESMHSCKDATTSPTLVPQGLYHISYSQTLRQLRRTYSVAYTLVRLSTLSGLRPSSSASDFRNIYEVHQRAS